MDKLVVFRRKKRQGVAPSLTVGNSYQVIDEKDEDHRKKVLIKNDRGVNKWYYRDDFEKGNPEPTAKEIAMGFARYLERNSIVRNPFDDMWYGYQIKRAPLEKHYDDFIQSLK